MYNFLQLLQMHALYSKECAIEIEHSFLISSPTATSLYCLSYSEVTSSF